jgi:hypothetical protein
MRLLFAIVVLLLLGTFAPLRLQRPEPVPAATFLTFEAVPLDEDDRERRRLGPLVYLGGWNIESNDPRFGGISAAHVEDREVIAFSDAGWMIRFSLPVDARPVRADLRQLPQGPGSATAKTDRDIESVAVHGARAWIGYERANAVWRYRRADWNAEASAAPREMRRWRANRGSEAIARLPDGRFLVFSEGSGGDSEAVLFEGDPTEKGTEAVKLKYRPPNGYRVTDAAALPDGRLIFLNRRVRLLEGFSSKLSLATPGPLKAGSVIQGREIAVFTGAVIADNFEALSLSHDGRRTILWIASDDNYNQLQRTLLLKFALAD